MQQLAEEADALRARMEEGRAREEELQEQVRQVEKERTGLAQRCRQLQLQSDVAGRSASDGDARVQAMAKRMKEQEAVFVGHMREVSSDLEVWACLCVCRCGIPRLADCMMLSCDGILQRAQAATSRKEKRLKARIAELKMVLAAVSQEHVSAKLPHPLQRDKHGTLTCCTVVCGCSHHRGNCAA